MSFLKNKKQLKVYYEILMALLSICAIVTLIVDFSLELNPNYITILSYIDNIIIVIFSIDYFARFYLAKNKKEFVLHNIIDLIAIIPFSSIFQGIRILRFIKIIRLLRVIVLLFKVKKHANNFIRTNNFHYVIWITLITLVIGTFGIHFAEGLTLGNAVWWSFVTITTVGYGDISPASPIGRLIAGFLMLIGIGFLSMLTSTIATFFLKKSSKASYKNEVIESIKSNLDNFDDLSKEDIENICNVLKSLKSNTDLKNSL